MHPLSEPESRLEQLVSQIALGVSGRVGDAFFESLTQHLQQALDADYVLAGELEPGGLRIRTLAAWNRTEKQPPFTYDLPGTPCENVVSRQICTYPEAVATKFPTDQLLVDMRAEGYVGTPMLDSEGNCLGLLCGISRRPLENPRLAEALLKIFAARAGAELELGRSEQRLRALVEHSTEGVVHMGLRHPIPLQLDEEEQLKRVYRDAYIIDCNQQAALLYGYASAEEMRGRNVLTPSPEQDERLRVGFRAGWQTSTVENNIHGRKLLVSRRGYFKDGHVEGAWITLRDVSELKEAEAEVHRLNAELAARLQEVTQLKAQLEQDNAYLLDEINTQHNLDDLIGSSQRFRELTERIRLVAPTNATVLITGESGTGKELVARAIHNLSPRKGRPLVKVNCAAIPANLMESELFGHARGAFTGATDRRIGRFEFANHGTIFLDEIGEIPHEMQVKLLRVLQEQEFEPLGSNQTVKIDVRVLAATNRNLEEAVRQGRFRADLYYRLHVVPVDVPALRDRREDIPALATHFIQRMARQFGRTIDRISDDAMRYLTTYEWPGNVRELENFLARAVILSSGTTLELPPMTATPAMAIAQSGPSLSLEDAERRHIEGVLASTKWVLEGPSGAAARLKMNPSTLRSKMKRLGIHRPLTRA